MDRRDTKDLIAAIEQRLETEAQSLSEVQATKLREEVRGFVRAIQKHWNNDLLVEKFCVEIECQFLKHAWADLLRKRGGV